MNNNLSKYACKNSDFIRLEEEKEDVRPPFFHDTDRIIYSLSFNRYIDKTQVFSFQDNDHITKRITHVIMVSKIARTIGRLLNLNEDLIEAIALGHDVGHCPIGHVGESFLNKIAREKLNEAFMHNIQSVRNYITLENGGKGLNLTIQVLDGIMCHNGETLNNIYSPVKKTKEEFLNEYKKALKDNRVSLSMHPMTLEGCVVRLSDVIAYIGRDIEDAINLGVVKREEIPAHIVEVLGNNNREIINTIILDVVENSKDMPYIKMSDTVYNALEELKRFNYKNIYYKANSFEDREYYNKAFNTLYSKYIDDLNNEDKSSSIYQVFLNNMNMNYINNTKKERIVIDFIAGMTDGFFIEQYNRCNKC